MHRQTQRKKSSFDYKLNIAYWFGMMLQTLLPINGVTRILIAIVLIGFLTSFAIKCRKKNQWHWQGLTWFDLLRSICFLVIGSYFWSYYIAGMSRYINHNKRPPTNSLTIFQEAIDVIPKLLKSTDPAVVFIVSGWLIFLMLVSLKLAYFSEEEFLKDCSKKDVAKFTLSQNNKHIGNTYPRTIFSEVANFFVLRPFIVKKYPNYVRVEFFKISSQDIREKSFLIIFLMMYCFFAVFGLCQMLIAIIKIYLDYPDLPEYVKYFYLILFFLVIIVTIGISHWFWNRLFCTIFTKRIVDFNANEMVVSEILFGKIYKIFNVSQEDLLPLIEIKKQTNIPEVKNSALLIQKQGGKEELAGHLLPEAMEIIQKVYDCYRTSTFNEFYVQTQSVYLK